MTADLDERIDAWRGHVERRRAIAPHDVDEMETHLRDQVRDLRAVGLDDEEAFLVAVKRLGRLDAVSHEFAQEHGDRLWKQLVEGEDPDRDRDLGLVLALAAGAAVAVRLGIALLSPERAATNAVLLVLPFVTAYFLVQRRPPRGTVAAVVAAYAGAAVVLNAYPFEVGADDGADTVVIAVVHAAVAMWLLGVGGAYAAGRWRSDRRRMDFIRFTGEIVIYYALLALGGGVLVGLLGAALVAADLDPSEALALWVLPCGAAGAAVVAAWLVEAKQSVIENIAPVLTKVFTPLTVLMLLAVAGALASGPGAVEVDRNLLIVTDLMLLLVVGLVLYALSARDPDGPSGWFDRLQLVLVGLALLVDALVAASMVGRVAELGWTPNRATALGLNVVLLVNLVGSGWRAIGFDRGRHGVAALERWHTAYLAVYAGWAVAVVLVVPPLFGFA